MQLKPASAFLLFLGSYFPLAIILALQDISKEKWSEKLCYNLRNCDFHLFDHPVLSLMGILVTGLCFALTIVILQSIRYKYPVRVIESKSIPNELISYSFPYIISFMGVDFGSAGKIAGLIAFLVWLFVITYCAGQIIMNPLLVVFGWNLYEAKVIINGHERVAKILSRGNLMPGNYYCQEIQQNFICRGEPND
jgi:hypothetical protein